MTDAQILGKKFVIYFMNGTSLVGIIKEIEKFSIVLEVGTNKTEVILFKHAITAISPAKLQNFESK